MFVHAYPPYFIKTCIYNNVLYIHTYIYIKYGSSPVCDFRAAAIFFHFLHRLGIWIPLPSLETLTFRLFFLKFWNFVRILPRPFFLNTQQRKASWQSADWQLWGWHSYLLLKQIRKHVLLKYCDVCLLKSSLGTNLCLDPKGTRMLCCLSKLLQMFKLLPS